MKENIARIFKDTTLRRACEVIGRNNYLYTIRDQQNRVTFVSSDKVLSIGTWVMLEGNNITAVVQRPAQPLTFQV